MSLTAEQLEERCTGIGGSDAPAIAGCFMSRTPVDVWLAKTGQREPRPETPVMAWGRRLEPLVLQAYEERTGAAVLPSLGTRRHEKHNWMLANIDGLRQDANGAQRIVEIKTSRFGRGWGEDGTDEVPDHVRIQALHYMHVYGLSLADVAVLIGGSDFRCYTLAYDPEAAESLVELERAFWGNVQRREPPSAKTTEDLRKLYPLSTARRVRASREIFSTHRRLLQLRASAAELDAQIEEAKVVLGAFMGEAEELIDDASDILATFRLHRAHTRKPVEIPAGRVLRIVEPDDDAA